MKDGRTDGGKGEKGERGGGPVALPALGDGGGGGTDDAVVVAAGKVGVTVVCRGSPPTSDSDEGGCDGGCCRC